MTRNSKNRKFHYNPMNFFYCRVSSDWMIPTNLNPKGFICCCYYGFIFAIGKEPVDCINLDNQKWWDIPIQMTTKLFYIYEFFVNNYYYNNIQIKLK